MCLRILLLLFTLTAFGCSHWRFVEPARFEEINDDTPLIRIVKPDGSVIESRNYRITADSLFIFSGKTLFYGGHKTAISLDEVAKVEKLEPNYVNSALLAVAAVIGMYALISYGNGLQDAFSGLGH
ncbi:hypothetical protein GWO43_02220 [candidate division KSB1 bacterium]|nr:hypothetical protein [candidate division KSB1 bacterium]NIR69657.1 hypothetical protein [candidate division KSB1 bacterium]NIS22886.1 hypothetical protein [candidate division KSB1 bacterium]NIT69725.1 hypothetical protein [candidate division KSB1 bacterium]NIU23392.1 hypothetical protein [candidate division KSB1 bacterium]